MMKTVLAFFLFGAGIFFQCQAQSNNVFSSYQCDPISCAEEGPLEENGSVFVSFDGVCTEGDPISKDVEVIIANCSLPYKPYALVLTSETEYYDEDSCPPTVYSIGYVTLTGEVFDALGNTIYHFATTFGCDGSVSGPTTFGTKPC